MTARCPRTRDWTRRSSAFMRIPPPWSSRSPFACAAGPPSPMGVRLNDLHLDTTDYSRAYVVYECGYNAANEAGYSIYHWYEEDEHYAESCCGTVSKGGCDEKERNEYQ